MHQVACIEIILEIGACLFLICSVHWELKSKRLNQVMKRCTKIYNLFSVKLTTVLIKKPQNLVA